MTEIRCVFVDILTAYVPCAAQQQAALLAAQQLSAKTLASNAAFGLSQMGSAPLLATPTASPSVIQEALMRAKLLVSLFILMSCGTRNGVRDLLL